jgi:adenosylmethionine-8-amino-7-oxononanoate aminotransferase
LRGPAERFGVTPDRIGKEKGLLVRVKGDIIVRSPLLIINTAQIDEIATKTGNTLDRID